MMLPKLPEYIDEGKYSHEYQIIKKCKCLGSRANVYRNDETGNCLTKCQYCGAIDWY